MFPIEFAKGALEKELMNCALIKNTIMPKKLDGNVALMHAILVVRLPPPQPQAPRQPPPPQQPPRRATPLEVSLSDSSIPSLTVAATPKADLLVGIHHNPRPQHTQLGNREITRGAKDPALVSVFDPIMDDLRTRV